MRKLAANFLVTDAGLFLKNGIVVASDDGTVIQMIDTKGDLRESELLTFHNGILLTAFSFNKIGTSNQFSGNDQRFSAFVLRLVAGSNQFSVQNMVDLYRKVQDEFPEMKIPSIMNDITETLVRNGGFIKETIPGIYLLTGVDLVELHFTPKSRLRKVL